jgi:DNA-binding transcriptional MerR regulator
MRRYRMKAVSRLTGVRPELLRMWERRYRLLKPGRADNRYREFDDEDVQLLLYIRQQIDQGRSIGELAAEGREALLRRLVPPTAAAAQEPQNTALIEELLQYLQHLDMKRLETRLAECAMHCSFATLLHTVFVPLMHRLGELWRAQKMPIVSEHLATILLQQRLLTMLQATAPGVDAPLLLCACPPGEFHTLGLLTFVYTMQQDGWQVCYLGPDLPLGDLLYSCQQLQPALVAVSMTHVTDISRCRAVLHDIDTTVASTYRTFVGGQGIVMHQHSLRLRHALCMPTIQEAQAQARCLQATLVTPRVAQPALGKVAVPQ